MKKSILKTLPSVLLLVAAFIALGGCKKKDEKSHIEITNVDATILQDCIDYPEIKDTFSIVLDKYPEGILSGTIDPDFITALSLDRKSVV